MLSRGDDITVAPNPTLVSNQTLALTLTFAQIYQQLQQQVVSSQPADRQAQLSVSLQRLMAEVQRNLEPKNRDKFTQARSGFCCRLAPLARMLGAAAMPTVASC